MGMYMFLKEEEGECVGREGVERANVPVVRTADLGNWLIWNLLRFGHIQDLSSHAVSRFGSFLGLCVIICPANGAGDICSPETGRNVSHLPQCGIKGDTHLVSGILLLAASTSLFPFLKLYLGLSGKKHSHEKLWKLVGHGMAHGPESVSISTHVGSGSMGSKMAAHSPGSCAQRPLQESTPSRFLLRMGLPSLLGISCLLRFHIPNLFLFFFFTLLERLVVLGTRRSR